MLIACLLISSAHDCGIASAAAIRGEQTTQISPPANALQAEQPISAPSNDNAAASDTNTAQFAGDLSALENKFYSHDFADEPTEKRLERIERLVYGAAKTGPIQDRMTQLLLSVPLAADPVQDSNPNVQADEAAAAVQPAINGPQAHWSLQGDVTAMEKEVFGKTFSSDSLTSRVSRLETTVFAGQPAQTFVPVRDRINKLMAALRPQFSVPSSYYAGKPIASSYKQARDEDEKKKGHPFWHKVGTVLADVGRVAAEGAVGMAASGMMMGGYGYGYGGYSGYGPYGYNGGFGYPGGFGPGGYW